MAAGAFQKKDASNAAGAIAKVEPQKKKKDKKKKKDAKVVKEKPKKTIYEKLDKFAEDVMQVK